MKLGKWKEHGHGRGRGFRSRSFHLTVVFGGFDGRCGGSCCYIGCCCLLHCKLIQFFNSVHVHEASPGEVRRTGPY